MKKTIQVDSKIVDTMQKLDLEMSSRKELIAFMLANSMNTNSEQFKEYENEYQKFFLEYSLRKSEIEKEYVLPNLTENQYANWTLDYSTGELTYEC